MPAPDPYVVVHGGVHKTATSFVQSILQRNAGKMRKSGVHYIHHRDTRKDFTYPCQLKGYELLGMDYRRKYTDDELRAETLKFFDKVGAGPGERIILSDENMPGHCGHCVGRGYLYSRRHVLIPLFAREIPYPVREVHLAVRNYADFFASAYVEYLRSASGRGAVVGEAQMKRGLLSKLPSWADFIREVARAFEGAEMVIWRHEDFGALNDRIVQNLIGPDVDVAKLARPKRSRGRPSASQRAIDELLIAIKRDGAEAGLAQRVAIQDRYPRGPDYPGYDPWSAQERAHLIRTYERDMEAIGNMADVRMLEPEHA